MPIKAKCRSCGAAVKAPSSLAGKSVKCPRCKNLIQFSVEESRPVSGIPVVYPATSDDQTNCPVVHLADADDVQSCPFCAKEIKATARKCRHCKEFLDQGTQAGHPSNSHTRLLATGSVPPWDDPAPQGTVCGPRGNNNDDRPWWKTAWDALTKKKCPLCKQSGGQTTHEVVIKTTDDRECVTKWGYSHGHAAPRVRQVVMRTVVYDEYYRCDKCAHTWSQRLTRKSEVGLVRLLWEAYKGEKPGKEST